MMDKIKIDEAMQFLTSELKKELSQRIEGCMYFGSYSRGDISMINPNVNIAIFFKDRMSANDALKVGEIFYKAVDKFKDYFVLVPDFKPYRFAVPKYKGETVYVNFSCLSIADKPGFDVPPAYLVGLISSRKVIFGNDIFKDFPEPKLELASFKKGAAGLISMAYHILRRAPWVYDMNEQPELLFTEAVEQAKVMIYFALEAAMTQDELNKKEYLNYIANKDKMYDFFKARYSKGIADLVSKILDARKHYNEWKYKPEKAEEIFTTSHDLILELRKHFIGA